MSNVTKLSDFKKKPKKEFKDTEKNYFEEIIKKNQENKKRVEEERKHNNKRTARMNRLK
jgi:hypothetical protein